MQNTTKPLQKCSWMELPRWLPCLKWLEFFWRTALLDVPLYHWCYGKTLNTLRILRHGWITWSAWKMCGPLALHLALPRVCINWFWYIWTLVSCCAAATVVVLWILMAISWSPCSGINVHQSDQSFQACLNSGHLMLQVLYCNWWAVYHNRDLQHSLDNRIDCRTPVQEAESVDTTAIKMLWWICRAQKSDVG